MGLRCNSLAILPVLAAGLAVAGAAEARTFHVVRSGAEAWTVMDPQAIEAVAGTAVRRAWSVTVQRNIHSPGIPPQPGYVRTLYEFDCQTSQVRWRSLSAFSRTGVQLVSEENKSAEWTPASAGAETLVAWRVACTGTGGDSVIAADSIGRVVVALMQRFDAQSASPLSETPVPAPKRR